MFKFFKDNAIVNRLIYVNNKSTLSVTWNSYLGYLKPLKPDDSLYQWSFWKDFSFSTSQNADIIESDVLLINWINYDVKWIGEWNWINIKYKKLLLVKK